MLAAIVTILLHDFCFKSFVAIPADDFENFCLLYGVCEGFLRSMFKSGCELMHWAAVFLFTEMYCLF